MRNKVSNSLFKKGLISFATASILASGVYASSTVSVTSASTKKYLISSTYDQNQTVPKITINFSGVLPDSGADVNSTGDYIVLELPSGYAWSATGTGGNGVLDCNLSETNTSKIAVKMYDANGNSNAELNTSGTYFSADNNVSNTPGVQVYATTNLTGDFNSTTATVSELLTSASTDTNATSSNLKDSSTASKLKIVFADRNETTADSITSMTIENLKIFVKDSASAGDVTMNISGSLQGLDTHSSVKIGTATSSILTVSQTNSSDTVPIRATGTVSNAPLSLTFTPTIAGSLADSTVKLSLTNAKFYATAYASDSNWSADASREVNSSSTNANTNELYVEFNNSSVSYTVLDGNDYNLSLVDSTVGDVTLTVSDGSSSGVTAQSFVIASVAEPGVTASYYDKDTTTTSYKTYYTGRDNQAIGDEVRILEVAAGSLQKDKTLTLTLSNGAKFNDETINWDTSTAISGYTPSTPVINTTWSATFPSATITNTITTASTTGAGAIALSFTTSDINLTNATAGDLNVIVGGSSLSTTHTVKVAEVIDATSVSVGTAPVTTLGSTFTVPDITLTENKYAAVGTDTIFVQLPSSFTIQTASGIAATNNQANGSTKDLGVTVTVKKADGTDVTSNIVGSTPTVTAEEDSNSVVNRLAIKVSSASTSTTGPLTFTISGLKAKSSTSASVGDIEAIISSAADATVIASTSITNMLAAAGGSGATKHTGVKVGEIVSATIPSITTSGITDGDSDLATASDKSLTATLTVAGNDAGKTGSIFVFTDGGKYITSAGEVTDTAVAFDSSLDSISLGSHTITIFDNEAIPTALASGDKIYVGYGVGFTTATAVSSLNTNATAKLAATLTTSDVAADTALATTDTTVTVIAGSTKDITFTGANTTLTATPADSTIATVTSASDTSLTISGEKEGNTTISVTDGMDTVTINVGVVSASSIETVSTPAVKMGWNLLGNASNNTVKAEDFAVLGENVWTFMNDSGWVANESILPMQGFWYNAKADKPALEFPMSGDGTGQVEYPNDGSWHLLACDMDGETLGSLKASKSATEIYTHMDGTWYSATDNADQTISVGMGYWIK